MNIGVMQGRLLDFKKNNPQSFPYKNWLKELKIANKLKINSIQWLFVNNKIKKNPLLEKISQTEILKSTKVFKVKIDSICAHEFIDNPLIINKSLNVVSMDLLKKIIQISGKLKIRYIVIPFIENSKLNKNSDLKIMKIFFKEIAPYLRKYKVELHLETDLKTNILNKEIKKIKCKYLKICIDLGNLEFYGQNLSDELKNAGNLLGCIHLKDKGRKGKSMPLGLGNVDFKLFFSIIKKMNYKGDMILETQSFPKHSALYSMKKNLEYINRLSSI